MESKGHLHSSCQVSLLMTVSTGFNAITVIGRSVVIALPKLSWIGLFLGLAEPLVRPNPCQLLLPRIFLWALVENPQPKCTCKLPI